MAKNENKSDPIPIFAVIAVVFVLGITAMQPQNGGNSAGKWTPGPGKIGAKYPVTQREYELLCNLLGNEYGLDEISVPEKARVIQTVVNRVNSDDFPDTIYGVISAPGQFDGFDPSYGFSDRATDSVKEAVMYCLDGKCTGERALYFWGDNERNYFFLDYDSWCRSYYGSN